MSTLDMPVMEDHVLHAPENDVLMVNAVDVKGVEHIVERRERWDEDHVMNPVVRDGGGIVAHQRGYSLTWHSHC